MQGLNEGEIVPLQARREIPKCPSWTRINALRKNGKENHTLKDMAIARYFQLAARITWTSSGRCATA